jgi:hypothetical protein
MENVAGRLLEFDAGAGAGAGVRSQGKVRLLVQPCQLVVL